MDSPYPLLRPRILLCGCSPQLRFAPKPSLAKGIFVVLLFGGCGGRGHTFHPCKWDSYFLHHLSLSLIYLGPYTFLPRPPGLWALCQPLLCTMQTRTVCSPAGEDVGHRGDPYTHGSGDHYDTRDMFQRHVKSKRVLDLENRKAHLRREVGFWLDPEGWIETLAR